MLLRRLNTVAKDLDVKGADQVCVNSLASGLLIN